MKKIIFMLILFYLLSTFLNSADAMDDKRPSLFVIYQRDKDSINPDETIKFDVFLPGDGNIILCRCTIFYNNNIYENIAIKTFNEPNKPLDVSIPAHSFNINISVFHNVQGEPWYPTPAEIGAEPEGSEEVVAPIRLWVDTKSNIPSGKQYLTLVLSYTDENEWYTYEKNLEFHVNDFFEQYPYVLPIIVAIISVIFGAIIAEIRHKLKKEKSKIKI